MPVSVFGYVVRLFNNTVYRTDDTGFVTFTGPILFRNKKGYGDDARFGFRLRRLSFQQYRIDDTGFVTFTGPVLLRN